MIQAYRNVVGRIVPQTTLNHHVTNTFCHSKCLSYRFMASSCNVGKIDKNHAIWNMPKIFSTLEFSENRYELDRHGHGESYHPTQAPSMIVYPKSTREVQQVVQYCIQHFIPMIPFGAGTSIEGHVTALQPHTLSIDMAKYMTKIHQIPSLDQEYVEGRQQQATTKDAYAVVDAGVTRLQLQTALKHSGFWFSVDPGADATIGGMVATGASGTTAVKYGTIKDNILELTAVLATTPQAPIVHLGTKALKNSAGYNLMALLCGSEGTLAIITQVTVKLHPVPQHIVAMTCTFDTLHVAAQAVATLLLHGVDLLRCELLDAKAVQIFDESLTNNDSGQDSFQPTLFLELASVTMAALQEQVKLIQQILEDDAQSWTLAYEEQSRLQLWRTRHGLYYAALASRPGAKGAATTDACVPLSHLADLIVATAQDVQKENVVGPCFGHAGDGNFHCVLPILENDSHEYWQKIRRIQDNLIQRTLAVGGTCTGEHGIGVTKQKYLAQQYNPETIQTMKIIKKAMDPFNLLNPGKIVDIADEHMEKMD